MGWAFVGIWLRGERQWPPVVRAKHKFVLETRGPLVRARVRLRVEEQSRRETGLSEAYDPSSK